MSRAASVSGARLAGIACSGIALSHLLAYAIATPQETERVHVLAETGHGYLPSFVVASIFLSVLALVAVGARAWNFAHEGGPSVVQIAKRLFVLQASGFLAIESIERFLSGNGLSLAGSPVGIALALQILLAVAGAVLLSLVRGTVRAIKRLVERSSRSQAKADPRFSLPRNDDVPSLLARCEIALRGPPLVHP